MMTKMAALTSVLSHQERKKISALNLSDFASLREASVTQSKEFFTPSRQGAKVKPTISYQLSTMSSQLCPA
jgi:hypothetical protein